MTAARATYDRFASCYDAAMRPLERWFLRRMRAEALSYLPRDSRILEVGAGTGLNFPHYPEGTCGAATELSCAMIEQARDKELPRGVHVVQNSAEALPFTAASFDAAFATLVLCSLGSPRTALAELRRVVRPGGTVVLLEHVRPKGLLGPLFDALSLFTVPLFDDHFNRRTETEARLSGLELVRVDRRAFGIIALMVCRV